MKLSAAASFSAILSLAQAQWWGGGRGGIGPDGGPDGYGFDGCAVSLRILQLWPRNDQSIDIF